MRTSIEPLPVYAFTTTLTVRIADINYGNHVGNDAVLSLLHEARLQYLRAHGFSELNFAGAGLIMRDANLRYLREMFWSDGLEVDVAAERLGNSAFVLHYRIRKGAGEVCVLAQTGMVCFDYSARRPVAIPAEAMSLFAE